MDLRISRLNFIPVLLNFALFIGGYPLASAADRSCNKLIQAQSARASTAKITTAFELQGLRVGELANGAGEIYLFRKIDSYYVKGFKSTRYRDNLIGASFTLNPGITWSGYLLIAKQNLNTDFLTYPKKVSASVMQTADEVFEGYKTPLTAETQISDIAYYEEVKVPTEKENVIAVLSSSELKRILAQFSGKQFLIEELIDSFLANAKKVK